MTEDEIVELGEFVDDLFASHHFNRLTAEFEHSAAQEMLATKPEASDERELIYNTLHGCRTFLAFLNDVATQRAKIIERSNPTETDEEDDDSVIMTEDDLFDPVPPESN